MLLGHMFRNRAKKMAPAQVDLCRHVGRLLSLTSGYRKSDNVSHFVTEGESKRTIYGIIERYEDGQSMERKEGGGYYETD